jgi:hypothetical protein
LNDVELSKRLADSATKRALTKFTWHESQKKLVKVYEKSYSPLKRDLQGLEIFLTLPQALRGPPFSHHKHPICFL